MNACAFADRPDMAGTAMRPQHRYARHIWTHVKVPWFCGVFPPRPK